MLNIRSQRTNIRPYAISDLARKFGNFRQSKPDFFTPCTTILGILWGCILPIRKNFRPAAASFAANNVKWVHKGVGDWGIMGRVGRRLYRKSRATWPVTAAAGNSFFPGRSTRPCLSLRCRRGQLPRTCKDIFDVSLRCGQGQLPQHTLKPHRCPHPIITNQKNINYLLFIIYYLLSHPPSNFPSCIFQSNVL